MIVAKKQWTYEMAGVPHLKGDPNYNKKIAGWIKSTHIPGVTGNKTGFAALFDLKTQGFRDPLLVTSTDGVGTKLEIAALTGRHDTIGIDLVAMCVNDILTAGAKPVIFLDYFASGKFEPQTVGQVLQGITHGCREAGCALVGGETAIMPGFYQTGRSHAGQYDVAGFAAGLVEKQKLVDGHSIRPGDLLLGIASAGVHSNGFSLIRRVFKAKELKGSIGRAFLTPTRIYVKPVLALLQTLVLRGIVNITGGGFVDNVPRVLPRGLGAQIWKKSWPVPEIFNLIQKRGDISGHEMMRTFNLGIGMILIVRPEDTAQTQYKLTRMKLPNWIIGEVLRGRGVEVR